MRELPAAERARCFSEVALGYDDEQAVAEAGRCLRCPKPPCVAGCPVAVAIPAFIAAVAEKDFAGAYGAIRASNSLPAVCGRVCPQETQCERLCVRAKRGQPVAIGNLERFAADRHLREGAEKPAVPPDNGKRVAVVGAGPAGLTCAGALRQLGYGVTVFEALHRPGGVLTYGIPEFRLPKALVAAEVAQLEALGVELELNAVVGRTVLIDELLAEGYGAVFVGSGAGLPRFLGIPGEDFSGVYSANEFLTRLNLMGAYREDSYTPVKRGKRVAVIGGGNVAMDAARCALRLGAEVTVVYRRTVEDMPAREEEIRHAMEEGVAFVTLVAPEEILGQDGWVRALRVAPMKLGEPDASGRRSPKPSGEPSREIACDQVILAIGGSPNPLLASVTEGLQTDAGGCLIIDGNGMTARDAVYAGGDAVTGSATVILAMGAGRDAAAAIHARLSAQA
ncbi:MAG: NADPH-dependent glutamate synthase [Clostridia bacterium]|nr:NADPH-dependent glutamate synthase [Clostridia bacterium]